MQALSALFFPASRFPEPEQAQPYRHAIAAAHRGAVDLTDRLTRVGGTHASQGATMFDEFNCTTVAAIVNLLREHGLTNDCEVIVACDEAKSADALQGFLATFWPGRAVCGSCSLPETAKRGPKNELPAAAPFHR